MTRYRAEKIVTFFAQAYPTNRNNETITVENGGSYEFLINPNQIIITKEKRGFLLSAAAWICVGPFSAKCICLCGEGCLFDVSSDAAFVIVR